MRGTITANGGQQWRTTCARAAASPATPYNHHGDRACTITTVTEGGYVERWQVRDCGHQVRVEPLPELGDGVPVGVASGLTDDDERPRQRSDTTARQVALQIMEAAGLLTHDPASGHQRLLNEHETEGH